MRLIAILAAVLLLPACTAFSIADDLLGTDIEGTAVSESHERLEDYCEYFGDRPEERKARLDLLNAEGGRTGPYFIAQDCDGDGEPDV